MKHVSVAVCSGPTQRIRFTVSHGHSSKWSSHKHLHLLFSTTEILHTRTISVKFTSNLIHLDESASSSSSWSTTCSAGVKHIVMQSWSFCESHMFLFSSHQVSLSPWGRPTADLLLWFSSISCCCRWFNNPTVSPGAWWETAAKYSTCSQTRGHAGEEEEQDKGPSRVFFTCFTVTVIYSLTAAVCLVATEMTRSQH